MRGQTLVKLLAQLKGHLGESLLPNSTIDANYTQLLNTKQQEFASSHFWKFMDKRWDVQILPGERYYSFPTQTSSLDEETPETYSINFDHQPRVTTFYTNLWLDISEGIGPEEYNFLNPSQNQSMDPVQKWRFASDVDDPANPDTFEVWPLPASQSILRFWGQALPSTLDITNKATSVCELDDQLLSLHVAFDVLSGRDVKRAALMGKRAQARLLQCLAGTGGSDKTFFVGGAPGGSVKPIRVAPLVVVHG